MKLTTTQTTKTDIEIPVPCFYRDDKTSLIDIMGILDEKTFVRVWKSERRWSLTNSEVEMWQNELVNAHLNWQPITEEEFMTHYQDVYQKLSLTPKLTEL